MATMDSLKDKASNVAQGAAKTAKYVASVSKMRLEILKEQERIRRSYAKLGKVYYKDYVTDEEPDEAEYKPLCEDISASFRRINELREQIAEAKEAYSVGDEPCDAPTEEEVEILPPEEEKTE